MSRRHCGHKAIGGRIISHHHRRVHGMCGSGMGSVLLNREGGPGVGSSYPSIEQFQQITHSKIPMAGSGFAKGLGAGLGDKLSKLMVKPLKTKAHNIHFDF